MTLIEVRLLKNLQRISELSFLYCNFSVTLCHPTSLSSKYTPCCHPTPVTLEFCYFGIIPLKLGSLYIFRLLKNIQYDFFFFFFRQRQKEWLLSLLICFSKVKAISFTSVELSGIWHYFWCIPALTYKCCSWKVHHWKYTGIHFSYTDQMFNWQHIYFNLGFVQKFDHFLDKSCLFMTVICWMVLNYQGI